jgi:hypothetical protein
MEIPRKSGCTPPYTQEWLQAANNVLWISAGSWVAIESGSLVDGSEPAGNGMDTAVSKVKRESTLQVPVCEFSGTPNVNQDRSTLTEVIHLSRS